VTLSHKKFSEELKQFLPVPYPEN